MVFSSLARAAGAGLLLGTSMAPAAPAAAQQATVVTDSVFLQTAGSLGLLQMKLAKMAEDKGSSPGVKEFANRMMADYSNVNDELAAAAKQAALPRPVLMRQHQQVVDRFRRMGRGSFDRNYMAEMVRYHGEAVRLFREETETGRIASLKQTASRMLPSVQQHLALANETARSVGADVTASAAQGKSGT